MLLKDKLRELREAAGLTQEALSRAAGISSGNVRNYEQGIRMPGFPMMVKIAAVLGTDCRDFANCDDVIAATAEAPSQVKPGRPPKANGAGVTVKKKSKK
ncbi:helix-turn-helix domain-containing protein [Limnoglobus roseus]|uniref:XRE family transcriptional regulator n=1 Tax=Limnoglobus roseus TaxID=2598579 RepID=A0A5C1A816_9BACT|nr:helix-turn-helix transcriptional regulator [Limnoglobus roseus]QEL14323.1 XRE family transcriptional regulator [Limnoglobus roseus]